MARRGILVPARPALMESSEHEPTGAPGGTPAGDAAPDDRRPGLGGWLARLSPGGRGALVVAVLLIVAAAIAVPLTVAGGGGYPASFRAEFLRACETNASRSQCRCALQHIERHVSFHQFAQDQASYARTGRLPSYYRAVVLSCLRQ
jgi:hypothetical protein